MIDRKIHQIWIGPAQPPTKWLRSWQTMNPNWEYKLWGNKEIFTRKWRNQRLIDHYLKRYETMVKNKSVTGEDIFTLASGKVRTGESATLFAWHIIADIVRYEILYEEGGFMPGSDNLCIKCIDDRFPDNIDLYTIRTGNIHVDKLKILKNKYAGKPPKGSRDALLMDRYAYENTSPILACNKGNKFLDIIIKQLGKLKDDQLGEAVDTTGNVLMGKLIKKHNPRNIMMDDYMMDDNKRGISEYSIHYAGTTRNLYHLGR